MGVLNICDILTGNFGFIYLTGDDKKLYNWNNNIRVVLKNGSVSNIGMYNMEYKAIIIEKKKSIFNLFPKKQKYWVADEQLLDNVPEVYKHDGFLLNDYVYNLIKKHKDYKKCVKNKNLYELLKTFLPKKNEKLYANLDSFQEVHIPLNKMNEYDTEILKKKLWMLIDPKLPNGIKNKNRIIKIINNFYKFVCKNKS